MDNIINSPQVVEICKQNNIEYLGLFGSYSRGDFSDTSDVDLLVQYNKPVGYLTHAKIQNIFEDYFNKPVDLVFKNSIKPRVKPYIMKDLKTIYEER